MTIDCRTRGIPMREGTPIDAEGWHTFKLDEAKHDPFVVMQRLWDACNKAAGVTPQPDPERDAIYRKIIREMKR